jgi:hypothetical protein
MGTIALMTLQRRAVSFKRSAVLHARMNGEAVEGGG